MVPVVAFAGYSGSGKTTLIEKLTARLTEKGVRVAVVKHDAHGFEIDREGKDSDRFRRAGAQAVAITDAEKTAVIEQNGCTVWELLERLPRVDLVLVEGFKREAIVQIGISRRANGKGLPKPAVAFAAIVTDEAVESSVPVFSPEDIDGITEFIMKNQSDFTHFNEQGRAKMVNVGQKDVTHRDALAAGRVCVSRETYRLIESGGMKKGDVLTVAQVAGVMGAKRTSELIPMCHPVAIEGIDLKLSLNEADCCVEILAEVSCDGRTGVEMEALTAVSTAALTVYDMCKAVQKDIVIRDIRLLRKTGGVHGDFVREETK